MMDTKELEKEALNVIAPEDMDYVGSLSDFAQRIVEAGWRPIADNNIVDLGLQMYTVGWSYQEFIPIDNEGNINGEEIEPNYDWVYLAKDADKVVSKLEQQNREYHEQIRELASHIEQLRSGLNEAIEALVAETSESGSVKDSEIHDLRTLELSTPSQSLQLLTEQEREQCWKDGFYFCDSKTGFMSAEAIKEEADEYAKQRNE